MWSLDFRLEFVPLSLDRIDIQCHKFDPYRISQVTYHRACLILALEGFPSSLWILMYHSDVLAISQ
ncbi:hypothetical protein Tco_1169313, partial [Tanacetum coccineum]